MDIENFISEFKKTFVYNMLKDYVSDEKLFDHVVEGTEVIWMKEQTRQMWSMWQAAKAQADAPGHITVTHERFQELIAIGVKAALDEREQK